jgi:hypothetical protein
MTGRSITEGHFGGAHPCRYTAKGGDAMWVLMILTFAATNPPNLNYSPTIFSQEYSSKEKCEAAKATLQAGFLAQVEALNRIMTEKFQMGEVRNYESIFLQIICTEK